MNDQECPRPESRSPWVSGACRIQSSSLPASPLWRANQTVPRILCLRNPAPACLLGSFASGCVNGFSALPAGNRNNGSWNNRTNNANFWYATENNGTNAWNRNLNNNNANVNRNNNNKTNGYSLRCSQD